eukprot:6200076-Pleurochrysis_carterae.AAC.11
MGTRALILDMGTRSDECPLNTEANSSMVTRSGRAVIAGNSSDTVQHSQTSRSRRHSSICESSRPDLDAHVHRVIQTRARVCGVVSGARLRERSSAQRRCGRGSVVSAAIRPARRDGARGRLGRGGGDALLGERRQLVGAALLRTADVDRRLPHALPERHAARAARHARQHVAHGAQPDRHHRGAGAGAPAARVARLA